MKRILILLVLIIAISSVNLYTFANGDGSPSGRATEECKWHRESCGWFSGHREVCVRGGDGYVCECGDVTREC